MRKTKDYTYKAITVIEYSVLLAVLVSSLIAMQLYVKRAAFGKARSMIDEIGYGRQFDKDTIVDYGTVAKEDPPPDEDPCSANCAAWMSRNSRKCDTYRPGNEPRCCGGC